MKHIIPCFRSPLLPAPTRMALGHKLIKIVEWFDANQLEPLLSHDLNDIAALKDRTGEVLFQPLNPKFQPTASEKNTAVIMVREKGTGEFVACCASRLLELDGSLRKGLVSRTLLYSDARSLREALGRCLIKETCFRADEIEDADIAFSGGVWVHQRLARLGVVEPMMNLLHSYVIAHWRFLWMVGLATYRVAQRYGFQSYGYADFHDGVTLDFPEIGIPHTPTLLLVSKRSQARILYLADAA